MSVFAVRVRVRPDSVAEVRAGIGRMVAALDAEPPEGVRYAYAQLADGVTFLALLELAEGVSNPLPEIPACQEFQRDLATRWLDQPQPPAPEPLDVVGSFRLFG